MLPPPWPLRLLCLTVRRYTSPEEHSFFPGHLPDPVLPPLRYPRLLAPNTVDVNAHILSRYISEIVPAVCKPGDDEQHGSSVLCDITALQAISKRIHLGKFVAETKFQVRPLSSLSSPPSPWLNVHTSCGGGTGGRGGVPPPGAE